MWLRHHYQRSCLFQLQLRTVQVRTLLVAAGFTLALFGCRGSWNLSSPLRSEPNFDRLIELESNSANSRRGLSAADDASFDEQDQVHPQVAQRRPGGRTAASRHSERPATQERSAPEQIASEIEVKKPARDTQVARRKISDIEDDETLKEDDEHSTLLKQTQTAVKNRYRSDSYADTSTSPQSKPQSAQGKEHSNGKAETSGVVAIRMNDRQNLQKLEENSAHSQEQPLVVAASHQTSSPSSSSMVQPASHNRYHEEQKLVESSSSGKASVDGRQTELRWQEHLELAMKQLSDGVSSTDVTSATANEQKRQAIIKRLLAMALSDREMMTSSVEGLQPQEQEYLKYQLTALMDAIDPNGNPVSSRRWSLVMLNQRKAHEHLASLSNLEVSGLAFCTAVESFGVAERFSKYQFKPDQEVLLYCEVDNFVSEPSKDGKGFETQLQGSYEIVDSSGKRVADQSLPMDTHICRNRRRDYFIAYRIYMPQNISPGNYSLRLTIEDIKGRKFGQSEVAFQIQ